MRIDNSIPFTFANRSKNIGNTKNQNSTHFGSFSMSGDVLEAIHFMSIPKEFDSSIDTILSLSKSFALNDENISKFEKFTRDLNVDVFMKDVSESLSDGAPVLRADVKHIGEPDSTKREIPIPMDMLSSLKNLKDYLTYVIGDALQYSSIKV